MDPLELYAAPARRRVDEIFTTQRAAVEAAAELLCRAVERDELIYVFGAGGHTSLAAGELFFRVGGFANICPIAEQGLTAFSPARKFIALERCGGLGRALVEGCVHEAGGVLMVVHTIGVNATCVDAALAAKERGMPVIGVASRFWQNETPQDSPLRHASRKNLRDVARVYIDDCNPVADAAVELPGLAAPVGALSGVGTFFLLHLLEIETARLCAEAGITPPIWQNANTPEGERANEALLRRFSPRVGLL